MSAIECRPSQLTLDDKLRLRVLSSKPSESDRVIATRLADYLTCQPWRDGRCFLSVHDDWRTTTLHFTDRYKNVLCFCTTDREAAKRWAIDAALRGYLVFFGLKNKYSSSGLGTIDQIRRRCRGESNWWEEND